MQPTRSQESEPPAWPLMPLLRFLSVVWIVFGLVAVLLTRVGLYSLVFLPVVLGPAWLAAAPYLASFRRGLRSNRSPSPSRPTTAGSETNTSTQTGA